MGLDFVDCDVGEVDIEKEGEVELAHEEQGRERPPDLKMHEGSLECIEEIHGRDKFERN